MPPTYQELLVEMLPEVIETREQYEAASTRYSALLRKKKLTREEDKLERLFGLLLQDYDRRHGMPPDDSTPADLLQFLVEHSGKSAAELLQPVFGQRSHVNEALNGKRAISAAQAEKLGTLFHCQSRIVYGMGQGQPGAPFGPKIISPCFNPTKRRRTCGARYGLCLP
jgi:HTH-type transcriptional regulator / antitoxin HigA